MNKSLGRDLPVASKVQEGVWSCAGRYYKFKKNQGKVDGERWYDADGDDLIAFYEGTAHAGYFVPMPSDFVLVAKRTRKPRQPAMAGNNPAPRETATPARPRQRRSTPIYLFNTTIGV